MVELIETGYFNGENDECVITAVLNYLTARKFPVSYIAQVKDRFDKHPKNLKPGVRIEWLPKVLEDILNDEFEVTIFAASETNFDTFPEETKNKFRKIPEYSLLPVPETAILLAKTGEHNFHAYVNCFRGSLSFIINYDGFVNHYDPYETSGYVELKQKQKNGGRK